MPSSDLLPLLCYILNLRSCSCRLHCSVSFFQPSAIWLHKPHLQNRNRETFAELVVFQKVGREFVLHSDGINFLMREKRQQLVTVSDAKQLERFQKTCSVWKKHQIGIWRHSSGLDSFKHFNVTSDKSFSFSEALFGLLDSKVSMDPPRSRMQRSAGFLTTFTRAEGVGDGTPWSGTPDSHRGAPSRLMSSGDSFFLSCSRLGETSLCQHWWKILIS